MQTITDLAWLLVRVNADHAQGTLMLVSDHMLVPDHMLVFDHMLVYMQALL